MNETDISYLESSLYSKLHKQTLIKLDVLAQKGLIAESQYQNVAGREAYWNYIEPINLDSPSIPIVNKNGHLLREIKLPTSISQYVAYFCSGCIDTAIYFLDQVTKDVTARINISSDVNHEKIRNKQRENLQHHCTFLRDISTVIRRHKKRPERYPRQFSNYSTLQKLNIKLSKGEQIEIFTQNVNAISKQSDFEFKGYCLICHRYNEKKSNYCTIHTRNNTKKQDSPIRKRRNLFNRAYNNLHLKNTIDSALSAKHKGDSYTEQDRKNFLKERGYKRDKYFHSQCWSLQSWSKHNSENREFTIKLRAITQKYFNLEDNQQWDIHIINMFNEVIKLTKKTSHTKYIFPSLIDPSASIQELKSYLFDVFYNIRDYSELPAGFEHLSPIDFIYMLQVWSQMLLIEIAANKNSLKSFQNS